MNKQVTIPEGYIRRRDGSLVEFAKLPARDQLAHDLVETFSRQAIAESEALASFKHGCIAELVAHRAMMLADYDVSIGGKGGNLTLRTVDGHYRIQLAVSKTITFGPELEAAKALIDECLEEWSENIPAELKEIITKVFKINKKGRLDTQGILGLREHKFTHPKWKSAMQAIEDAIQRDLETTYVYFWATDPETGNEQRISLNIADL